MRSCKPSPIPHVPQKQMHFSFFSFVLCFSFFSFTLGKTALLHDRKKVGQQKTIKWKRQREKKKGLARTCETRTVLTNPTATGFKGVRYF